ncbi:hypothetical protein QCA50_012720 [Cerrena zonata]|uniref:Uncharacterized protein n=1 Tax=Cerrena zonata TaxID=2478898 RepID=A0AAW0G2F0_9APHY
MHKENGGLNEIGIFLGLFAAFFTPSLNSTTFKLSTERSGGSIFLSALGFGAYLFSIQFLISDSSTLIFWAWDGYPVTGPTPITGALINFFAIGLGITLSVKVHSNAFLGPTYNLLAGAFLCWYFSGYPTKPYHPYNSSSQSFTAGIWCVHFGLDNDMWSSEHRMKDLIKEAEVDIIGLLESDTQRLIGGNRDFTQTIAEELGMYADYGPGPNQHTWGAALLSKFPIISSSHHLLPSPVGELAPAIHATLDIYGELVDVVVFHSGQEEDEEDRRLQSLELQRIMGESERPLVLLSYLVTNPYEGNYNTYVSDKSRMRDIDSNDWDRWCEYILFRDLKKVAYARISRSTITDTELQIAKFKLLEEYQIEEGNDFIYGNHYIDEDEVDESLRMPQLFRGDGVRGHRYHVFDEPRYFAERPSQVRNDD